MADCIRRGLKRSGDDALMGADETTDDNAATGRQRFDPPSRWAAPVRLSTGEGFSRCGNSRIARAFAVAAGSKITCRARGFPRY